MIATNGSEEARLLECFQANANVGGEKLDHIILQQDARKIEALEEFLHGTQWRIGILTRRTVVEAEVHVKRFMVRHCKLLGISEEDAEIITAMLGGL